MQKTNQHYDSCYETTWFKHSFTLVHGTHQETSAVGYINNYTMLTSNMWLSKIIKRFILPHSDVFTLVIFINE